MSLSIGGRDIDRLLVVGYGRTGRAVARFCAQHHVGFRVTETSQLSPADVKWLEEHAEAFETGGHTLRLLDRVDAVIASPGAPIDLPLFVAAAARGVAVLSELDLASAVAAGRNLVAVTGTNGKSTTVSLIGALLERSGVPTVVAGNIGLPFLEVAGSGETWEVAVLEVSSFQLEQSMTFHPHVALLLNLAPNHLERHSSMAAYAAAKLRVFAQQGASDVAILPAELARTLDHGHGRLVLFDSPLPPLPRGSEEVGEIRRLNLGAAVTACREVAPRFDATRFSVHDLASALYLPYRQQPVGTARGVRFVNDSKATSPAATIAALRSTRGPAVLLLGGRSKRGGYDELARFLAASSPRAVIVYGEAREEIAVHLAASGVPHAVAADLEAAVSAALVAALPGDVLLLSPACSSFDAFGSYEERGEAFNQLVQCLPGFQPPVADI
jgi:UDP-N-acetylmuramoylalanine--D-glutamate ligase